MIKTLKNIINLSVKILVIILLASIIFSCTSSNQNFYSRNKLDENAIVNLYANVPVIRDDDIHQFIVRMEQPNWDIPKSAGITGEVICQVLIDTQAEVEAIYINQSGSPMLDVTIHEAVKESKFKSFKEVTGKNGKYSLLIPFNFWVGQPANEAMLRTISRGV